MKWLVIGLALAVVVAVLAWLTGGGDHPRYRTYDVEIALVVDGQDVTLAGTLRCARERSGINEGWETTYGLARPSTLAARLDSGDIVVAKLPSFCLTGIPEDAMEHLPSVFVFAGGDPPERIDAYIDPTYLRDESSAVHVRHVSYGPFSESAFPDLGGSDSPKSAADFIGWADAPAFQREHGPHWFYRGYMMDEIGFQGPAARKLLERVERQTEGLTRVDYDTEYGRETLRALEDDPSGRLGMHVDWADPNGRCRRDPDDPLCHVLTRQRPLRFEPDGEGRHVIDVPADPPRSPLRLLPVTGGPPPLYAGKIGYSGDEEMSDKVPATLIVGGERLDMPHDFISKYTLAVTIDWANERIFRVFLVEIEPSLFDDGG